MENILMIAGLVSAIGVIAMPMIILAYISEIRKEIQAARRQAHEDAKALIAAIQALGVE